MFDKYGFYFLKNIGFQKYDIDIGASLGLNLESNEYVVFHKRRFFKRNTKDLQKGMALLTRSVSKSFSLDEEFFIYGLTYYQRNLKDAFIKGGDLDELELYMDLYKSFTLDLKLRKYLEIHGEYKGIEQIQDLSKYASLDQAISFVLALSTVYGDWNIIEEEDGDYLGNILIRFPFDSSLGEFQDIIFNIEDILIKNGFYNKLFHTKKQDFIWNIYDTDLLKIMGESINKNRLKDFFQSDNVIKPMFNRKIETLEKQLNIDLRLNIENFKLVEIEGAKLGF